MYNIDKELVGFVTKQVHSSTLLCGSKAFTGSSWEIKIQEFSVHFYFREQQLMYLSIIYAFSNVQFIYIIVVYTLTFQYAVLIFDKNIDYRNRNYCVIIHHVTSKGKALLAINTLMFFLADFQFS